MSVTTSPAGGLKPGHEQGGLPEDWTVVRERNGVLALHKLGTAQPYRYCIGDIEHSLLLDLLEKNVVPAPTKPGRKPLTPGAHRVPTSISLTPDQHAQFKKLGASKWVRQKLEESMRCKDHES